MLPRDLVPMEGPVGETVIELALEGTSLAAEAKVNGKNYRRMLRQIGEQGAGNVVIVLQGLLRPPTSAGGPYVLGGAGFQVTVSYAR